MMKRSLYLGGATGALVAGAALYLTLARSATEGETRVVEAQANTYTFNSQFHASVDLDSEGNALVVWDSRRQEGGTFGLFGRLYDPRGVAIGDEIHINQRIPSAQRKPAVAFGPDDTAWVAWQSYAQDGSAGAIVARRFGRVGSSFAALSDEVVVNERTEGDQVQPTVAAGPNGAMIVWQSIEDDRQIVAGRTLNADGRFASPEITLASSADVHDTFGSVAAQPDGGFVVTWARRTIAGPPVGILAQRVGADGTMIGDAIAVAENADRFDVEPSVDADDHGRFVVAWIGTSQDGTGRYDVYARRFDADGHPAGPEIDVATSDTDQRWLSCAAVAMAGDGRFAVGYNAEGLRSGEPTENPVGGRVMARRYDADGTPAGAPFAVTTVTDGRQTMSNVAARRLVWSDRDQLAVAWQGETAEDSSAVGYTMIGRDDLASSRYAAVDESVLASAYADEMVFGLVPPDYNPNHVPQKAEDVQLAPGQDFGFIGFTATEWQPPDVDLAVGPNHIVQGVNMKIRWFTKDGTLQFDQDLRGANGFFGEVGSGTFVFDPVELYDPFSDRYIFCVLEHVGNQNAFLLIAVSDDDDPNGTWHKYRWNLIDVATFMDFPNLGVGPDAIYVATDFFGNQTNYVHVIDKAAVLEGDPTEPVSVPMSLSGRLSLGTVKSYEADQPAQYFASSYPTSNNIRLYAMRDALSSAIVDEFDVPVASFGNPPGAQQMGSGQRVATVDRRIKNGVYRNGSLWVAHAVDDGGVARTRWYEFAMNGWPTSGDDPTLVQQGTLNFGAGVATWFADVDVDDQGNAAFGFNRSSPTEFVSVSRTYRMAGDPLGTVREPAFMQTSSGPVTSGRYGDYGGIHQDYSEPNAFWTSQEYWTTDWRTWIGRFELPVETCPEDVDGSGDVGFDDLLMVLSAWGPCEGCPEDVDGSGDVGFDDLLMILSAWGPCE